MEKIKTVKTRDDILKLPLALTREYVFLQEKLLANALRIKGTI